MLGEAITFQKLLNAHFNNEGWHAVYKKYGSVLAKENYRWKRKVMKRFGPCRKCQFHGELMQNPVNTIMGRIGLQVLADELDAPTPLLKAKTWSGRPIPIIFGSPKP